MRAGGGGSGGSRRGGGSRRPGGSGRPGGGRRPGGGGRGGGFRREEPAPPPWNPRTRLGRMVAAGEITSLEQAAATGLPLREAGIIDKLLPNLSDAVLDVNMVQRMTDSGRRVKFRATVVVGNQDGYVGIGQGRDKQVGTAIKKATAIAKVNIIRVHRGCGSWECACGTPHTVPMEVMGEAGSVRIYLKPAPRGLGLAAAETAKKVLQLAGVRDVWTRVTGETRTAMNFSKATYDALRQTTLVKQ